MKTGPILLIDDDRDECGLVEEALALNKVSNELICFSNGKEALDFCGQRSVSPF